MKFIIVVILIIASVFAQYYDFEKTEATLGNILNNLPTKFCPMRGFDGSAYCPKPNTFSTESVYIAELDGFGVALPNDTKEEVFFSDFLSEQKIEEKEEMPEREPWVGGGFGYDRVKRELKFPVLPSHAPAPANRVQNEAKRFANVQEYLNHMYAEKGWFEAGFYTMNDEFMRNIAQQFGDYRIHITATQKHFVTHQSSISSHTPIDDFNQAIAALPPYDPNNPSSKQWYRMIIDYWGTDVATNSEHGGVIYQQNIVKACYGGSITEDLIRDIDAAIQKVPPGELAYLRYRRLGIFNARGGNPELGSDRMNERIASFAQAPAPLKFSATPLWHFIQDANKKEWMRQAIQHYINEFAPNLERIHHEIENAKVQTYKAHQAVYSYSYNVEQGGSLVVYWNGCPIARMKKSVYCPHCTIGGQAHGVNSGQQVGLYNALGVHYNADRDGNTGFARLLAYQNGNVIHGSPYVRTGCTVSPQFGIMQVGPWRVDVSQRLHRAICIDCLPIIEQRPAQHGHRHTVLNCVCPSF